MKIAYIKPSFPNEKRVGLLPQHLPYCTSEDKRRFEQGYGESLDISDEAYGHLGGYSRQSLFEWADVIYCIKVPQPQDYASFKPNQTLVGWVHPLGSGEHFMETCASSKNITVFDVTNRISIRHYRGQSEVLSVPRDITQRNSVLAGYASTLQAITLRGGVTKGERVAVFGSGNVAFGAMKYLSEKGITPILRRRSNLDLLRQELATYDILINGVEIEEGEPAIATRSMIDSMKPGAWVIDVAADAGRALEGTKYTSIDNPTYTDDKGHTFYVVNNSPSLLYRESSEAVSEGYARHFWAKPMDSWYSDHYVAYDGLPLAS